MWDSIDYEIVVRFLLAALWGGVVGAEREYRNKSAGFRTMIMISLGSCFFTMISIYLGGKENADRIAANIVTGIGFLGAGVIFRSDNKVTGITTAATIWTVAAVGMGIGAGHYFAATVGSLAILGVLGALRSIEKIIDAINKQRTYTVKINRADDLTVHMEELTRKCKLKFHATKEIIESDSHFLAFEAVGHWKNHDLLLAELRKYPNVARLEYS